MSSSIHGGAAAGGGSSRSAADGPGLRRHLRIVAFLGAVVVAFFVVCCTIYNAPASPAQIRLAGAAGEILNPYFEQDWRLFAPTPSTDLNGIVLEVRVQGSAGEQTVMPGVDVQAPLDTAPRNDRLNPTKQAGVTLAFQESFSNYARQYRTIRQAPQAQQAGQLLKLSTVFAPEFAELQRFLSVKADQLYPAATVLAVRATFTQQPITPFSHRYDTAAPVEKTSVILQTVWMPYLSGVNA